MDTLRRLITDAIGAATGAPLYLRIADAIDEGITTRQLSSGERLPTHRALAKDLGVAVTTVTRAYREAEQRGLLTSTVGRGTFVTGLPTLRATSSVSTVDLSVNAPAQGPHAERFRQALADAAAGADPSVLDYEADVGTLGDRELAAAWFNRSVGGSVRAGDVVLCHGGQHAILMALAATTARDGRPLLTEALTYPGVKSAAQLLGVEIAGVAMDADGLVPEALEAACRRLRPSTLYVMPNAHNPTAITLPQDRREAIVAIARRHDLTIVEDDVFGLLVDDGRRPSSFLALCPERTLSLTSLSKTLSPGLRWGAIASTPQTSDHLGALIRASIFNPAPIALEVARRWLRGDAADQLLRWQRDEMASRFAIVHRRLGGSPGVTAVRTAGLHAWVGLADPWTADEAIDAARRHDVEIGPTSYFAASGPAPLRHLRLCLGNAADAGALDTALTHLAHALHSPPNWAGGLRV